MTDRLSLTNALAEAKIDRPAAERIPTEIFDAIQGNVATKADLERLEAATKADLQHLEAATKADLQRLEAATKADLQHLETNLQAVRAELKTDIAALRAEMVLIEHRLLTRLGALVVVVSGLSFAA